MQQKFLWGGAILVVFGVATTFFTVDYARRHPDSVLSRFAVAATFAGLNPNPLVDINRFLSGQAEEACEPDVVEAQSGISPSVDVFDPAEETIEPIQIEMLPAATVEPPVYEDLDFFKENLGIGDSIDSIHISPLRPSIEFIDETPKPMPYIEEGDKQKPDFSLIMNKIMRACGAACADFCWPDAMGGSSNLPQTNNDGDDSPEEVSLPQRLQSYEWRHGSPSQRSANQGRQLIDPSANAEGEEEQAEEEESEQLIDPPASGDEPQESGIAIPAQSVSAIYPAQPFFNSQLPPENEQVEAGPRQQVRIQALILQVDSTNWPSAVQNLDFAVNYAQGVEAAVAESVEPSKLDTLISSLEKQGRISILAAPRITTAENQAARVFVGQSFPYVVDAKGTVDYRDVGVQLQVTPKISPDGIITMRLMLENSSAIPETYIQIAEGIFATMFQSQSVQTTVNLKGGQTAFIGGMTDTKEGGRTTQLLMMVTPHIEQPRSTNDAGEEEQAEEEESQQLIDPPANEEGEEEQAEEEESEQLIDPPSYGGGAYRWWHWKEPGEETQNPQQVAEEELRQAFAHLQLCKTKYANGEISITEFANARVRYEDCKAKVARFFLELGR